MGAQGIIISPNLHKDLQKKICFKYTDFTRRDYYRGRIFPDFRTRAGLHFTDLFPHIIMLEHPPVDFPTTTALILAFFLFLYNQWISRKVTLPPGPRRWPFIGNVTQLPQVNPWFTFREWAKTYGKYINYVPL